MLISVEQIKELREKTGAGISEVKKALEESGGDGAKALILIERRLGNLAGKRLGRETKAGLVESYIHSNGRIGSMLELTCETDFVARSSSFKELAHDLAMHIAAMNPRYTSLESVPKDIWAEAEKNFAEESRNLNKPEHILKEIINGKLKNYFGNISLLDQPFVKDQNKTVGEVIKEAMGRFGENIQVGQFIRLEV